VVTALVSAPRIKFERIRNVRGEMEDRPAGLGFLREHGEIEVLPDGALQHWLAEQRAREAAERK
jgi:hypothetical protein